MLSEETLTEFQCALSDDKHFIIEPITLANCGHSVCKSCLPNGKLSSIKCAKCGIITNQDLSKIQVSKALKQTLKYFLGDMLAVIERETSAKLNSLKSIIR